MAPTYDEIRSRLHLLPPDLGDAVRTALDGFEKEEKHFHSSLPADAQPPIDSSPVKWPGYLWLLGQFTPAALVSICTYGKYWDLRHEERALIRKRLNCTTADINLWRERGKGPDLTGKPSISSSGRTDPPGPGGRRGSTGDSPPQ